MPFYQITLNQGRTDTVTVEANTITDLKNFFNSVSNATIISVKKIVFSKDLGIGSGLTTYTPNNQDNFLNVMVKNEKGITGTLNIAFPIKNIPTDTISKSIKKNLTLNGLKIVEIINIIKANEGDSPIGA